MQELPSEQEELQEAARDAESTGALAASANAVVASIVLTDWTTRIAVCRDTRVVDAAVLALGARTLQISSDNRMLAISEDGETFLDAVAKRIRAGDVLDAAMPQLLANLMGETVVNAVSRTRPPQVSMRLLHSEPLSDYYDVRDFVVACKCLESRMATMFFQSLQESLSDRGFNWRIASV